MKRFQSGLLLAAALTLLVLGICPQTRWLAAMQAGCALHLCHPFEWAEDTMNETPDSVGFTGWPALDRQRVQAVVAHNPDNLSIQMASALPWSSGTTAGAPDLRRLLPRFPASPSLYANLLRCQMVSEIWLDRPEAEKFFDLPGTQHSPVLHVSIPLELARYDQEAAVGERLDPDNAYFPLMRAIGLFAAHQDAAGLASVQRASRKRYWREYMTDETWGHWQLRALAFGDRSAIDRMGALESLLLPHYQMLRLVARVTVFHAIQEEHAGHAPLGTSLRQALIRCGALMRVQSSSPMGSLLGIQITRIALARPGGAVLPRPPKPPAVIDARQSLNIYCAYLRQTHQADQIGPVIREYDAGEQVRAIFGFGFGDDTDRLLPNSPLWLLPRAILKDIIWWLADISLLTNILWLVILGALASRLARLPRLPLWNKSLGFWVVLVLTLAAIGTAANWQSNVRQDLAAAAQTFDEADYFGTFSLRDEFLAGFGFIGFLSVPLLLLLTLTVRSLVRRVPLAVGLVNGVRSTALPLACLLVLLYASLLAGTVQQKNTVNRALEQRQQDGGQYYAALTGKTWPQ